MEAFGNQRKDLSTSITATSNMSRGTVAVGDDADKILIDINKYDLLYMMVVTWSQLIYGQDTRNPSYHNKVIENTPTLGQVS